MTHRVFQPPQQRHRSDSWTASAGCTFEPWPSCHEALQWSRRGWGLAFLHRQQVTEANANGFRGP